MNYQEEFSATSTQAPISLFIQSRDTRTKTSGRNRYEQIISPPISSSQEDEYIRISLQDFSFINHFYNVPASCGLTVLETYDDESTKTYVYPIPEGNYSSSTFLSMLTTLTTTTGEAFFHSGRGYQSCALGVYNYKIELKRTYTGTYPPGGGSNPTSVKIQLPVTQSSMPILKIMGLISHDSFDTVDSQGNQVYVTHVTGGVASTYTPSFLPDFMGNKAIRIVSNRLRARNYKSQRGGDLSSSNIVAQIPITTPFGSVQHYQPSTENNWFILYRDDINSLDIELYDDQNQQIDSSSFPFQMEFRLDFLVKKKNVTPPSISRTIGARHTAITGHENESHDSLHTQHEHQFKRNRLF